MYILFVIILSVVPDDKTRILVRLD